MLSPFTGPLFRAVCKRKGRTTSLNEEGRQASLCMVRRLKFSKGGAVPWIHMRDARALHELTTHHLCPDGSRLGDAPNIALSSANLPLFLCSLLKLLDGLLRGSRGTRAGLRSLRRCSGR